MPLWTIDRVYTQVAFCAEGNTCIEVDVRDKLNSVPGIVHFGLGILDSTPLADQMCAFIVELRATLAGDDDYDPAGTCTPP